MITDWSIDHLRWVVLRRVRQPYRVAAWAATRHGLDRQSIPAIRDTAALKVATKARAGEVDVRDADALTAVFAVHTARVAARIKAPERDRRTWLSYTDSTESSYDEWSEPVTAAEDRLVQRQILAVLAGDAIGPADREVLVLRGTGLSAEQTAERLTITPAAVDARLCRARRRARHAVEAKLGSPLRELLPA